MAEFPERRKFPEYRKLVPDEATRERQRVQQAAYDAGREAGRREIWALVAKLPSPVEEPNWILHENPVRLEHHCRWCDARWDGPAETPHPANGCLWSLAAQTGKEQD